MRRVPFAPGGYMRFSHIIAAAIFVAPSEKQTPDKRGVMTWSFDALPGETKEFRLAWRVKWPADRDILTQPATR